jgi:glutathione synthase/RimK-type ligase-like ATP-grasp enzyme
MNSITFLVDYRNTLYSSISNADTLCSMNLEKLRAYFEALKITVVIINFYEVDLADEWGGRVVIYQSSEDPNLRYKSYIEDMILGLSLKGAYIIPEFKFLRAHHNKVFMEMLRDIIDIGTNLKSRSFGTIEDVKNFSLSYPAVVKTGYGAGSSGVKLLRDPETAYSTISKMMRSDIFTLSALKECGKRLIRKGYVPYSFHRNKIVIQDFISGLDHDYKVLIYGDRAFVVRREVRQNDFRASGSGKISWPKKLPDGLLEYAWSVFKKCDVSHVSLDIAFANNRYYLIEMQFVMFGSASLERANHYWQKVTDGWHVINKRVELELAFAEGVVDYSRRKGWLAEK